MAHLSLKLHLPTEAYTGFRIGLNKQTIIHQSYILIYLKKKRQMKRFDQTRAFRETEMIRILLKCTWTPLYGSNLGQKFFKFNNFFLPVFHTCNSRMHFVLFQYIVKVVTPVCT